VFPLEVLLLSCSYVSTVRSLDDGKARAMLGMRLMLPRGRYRPAPQGGRGGRHARPN